MVFQRELQQLLGRGGPPRKADGSAAASSAMARSGLDEEAEQEKAKKRKADVAQPSGVARVDARRVDREKVMKTFQEQDDTAIAQLNNNELQALAEQVQLQEEIKQFDLSSVDTFAYVLLAKLASFKRACNWLYLNRSKKITNVTWETGILLLLHVDTEKLTGMKPGEMFYHMTPPTGTITRRTWKTFFNGFKTLEELQKQRKEGRTLRERAAQRMKQYRRRGSLFRSDRRQRLKAKRGPCATLFRS